MQRRFAGPQRHIQFICALTRCCAGQRDWLTHEALHHACSISRHGYADMPLAGQMVATMHLSFYQMSYI